MAIRKSIKTTAPAAPPTLEERCNGALATADAAVSVFHQAAHDLETAAAELDDVQTAAAAESRYYADLSMAAGANAEQRREQAQAIRTLLGTAQN